MVSKEAITGLINGRLKRVLLIAQAALPESQFQAFRSLVLDEFGNSGLLRDLESLGKQDAMERQEMGRRN